MTRAAVEIISERQCSEARADDVLGAGSMASEGVRWNAGLSRRLPVQRRAWWRLATMARTRANVHGACDVAECEVAGVSAGRPSARRRAGLETGVRTVSACAGAETVTRQECGAE